MTAPPSSLWPRVVALVAVLSAGPTLADAAPDGAVALAPVLRWLEDPGGTLGVGDLAAPAVAARWQPAPDPARDLNFGYSASAWWLALPLPASAGPRLLELAYPSLDRAELFVPDAGGGYVRQISGDRLPYAGRPYPHRNLVFPLPPDAARTVYLRVESGGSLTLPLTLWTPEALHRHDQRTYALLSLYYGMLLALFAYNLLLYFSLREPVFLVYVGCVGSMAVGQASLNGFGNQFLWPDWPAWGNVALPVGMAATGLFGAWFTRLFLDTRRCSRRLDRAFALFMAAFGACVLLAFAGRYRPAAIATSVTGLTFALSAVAGGLWCLRRGHPGARWFLLAWSLLLVGVAVLSARNLGWLPTTAFSSYAMQAGSALEMLLLSFALADRINVMRRDKDRATHEALAARQAMVEALRRSEHDLEARVGKRTAALAASNARLRASERRLARLARHDPLTGLVNRNRLDECLREALARARRSGKGLAVLLADLDGFKAVNDRHGHAAGDELLVAVAGRMLGSVRETDTVARLGGDEFVILLENLAEPADAVAVAAKLVEAIRAPFELAGATVRVSLSVGIAHSPADGTDAQTLLQQADQAMYAAKAGGRDGWRQAGVGGARG